MKLFLILIFISIKAYSQTQVFNATARYEGRIVYLERHTVDYNGKTPKLSLTQFWDPEGNPIGIMKSDYSQNLGTPFYILQDFRHKSFQGVRIKNNILETFGQEGGPSANHTKLSSYEE